MKTALSALALAAALAASTGAWAQVPSGGPDAKGNAPLKRAHTVNDGSAKRGRTSFTKGQAQRHIEHAGYTGVSDLAKGDDGVWRGSAMKNGAPVQVGLDFKGNVSEGGADASSAMSSTTTTTQTSTSTRPASGAATSGMSTSSASSTTSSTGSEHAVRRHHRHRHHHRLHRCADPGVNGAACSGVDRNRNGISDKEDRAIKAGAKP